MIDYDNPWKYNGKDFTSDDIGEYQGFVYEILDKTTNMRYIGKKGFVSRRKLPPLKGKKRKRIKITESDWKTYYGSNEDIKHLIEETGSDRFERTILHLCKTKGAMSYLELKEQVEREVLFKPNEYTSPVSERTNE